MLLAAGVASAAPAPKLQVFGTGEVTVTGSDSATILNDSGEMGGVFIQPKSQGAKSLDKVTFAFESRGDIQGGAPRFSIPIDDPDVAGNQNGYAFFDAAGCGGVVGPGTSNVFVSTQNPACKVNFANRDYANWDAFADANPDYRTSPGWTPFIIADRRAPTS